MFNEKNVADKAEYVKFSGHNIVHTKQKKNSILKTGKTIRNEHLTWSVL